LEVNVQLIKQNVDWNYGMLGVEMETAYFIMGKGTRTASLEFSS
jgi:hypothetical protein